MGEQVEHDQLFDPRLQGENIQNPSIIDESIGINHRSGWTTWLIVAGICTTLGASLPVGYNIGVVNAPADIIKVYCNESIYDHYNISLSKGELDVVWSAIVSIFLIGGMTGSLTGSFLADLVGRKGAYIMSTLLNIIAGCLFYTCKYVNSFEILMIGRLIAGLAGGLVTCVVPMYLTELAPLYLRGAMGVLCPLGVTFGVLAGQVMSLREILGTEETWQELLAFYTLLVFGCALVLPFFPESPKYLYVVKKQYQKALKELSKIRGVPPASLSEEILDLQTEENNQNSNISWNLSKVIRDPKLLLPLLIMCFMQAGQQFSGINAVFYYSVSIFKNAGLDENASQLATIGAGGVNSLMAVVAIPLMSHCNRRSLFLFSCLTASICLIILGLSITFIHALTWMPYLCIVAVLTYVFFYQLGLGPIPYFIGSELFEVGPRSNAMALGSMSNWGGNFVIGMSFPSMQRSLGAGSFGVFAAITLCLLLFIRKYFPETRGRDPSEVAMLCKNGLLSRPFDVSVIDTTDTVVMTVRLCHTSKMDFILGGMAAVGAGFFTNPLEVLKIRMQLQGELQARGKHTIHYRNMFHAAVVIAKTDGILALQKGLIPALWTQLFLNGLRLGTYQCATSKGFTTDERGNIVFYKSIIVGVVGGAAGAAAASPLFLIKTHLQSQSAKSIAVGHQHQHTGLRHALRKIHAEHGLKGLWRGVEATIPRAAVGSAAQLTSFGLCKEWIIKQNIFVDSPVMISFCASLVGGIAISLAMTPFDLISTRIYNQGTNSKGKGLLYDGILDCIYKIWRTEGFLGFYKGLFPNYVRLGPHTVLCLVFWDKLKVLHDSFHNKIYENSKIFTKFF